MKKIAALIIFLMVVFSINVSALPAPDNYAFITISEELQKTYSVEGNEYTLMYRRYMPEN